MIARPGLVKTSKQLPGHTYEFNRSVQFTFGHTLRTRIAVLLTVTVMLAGCHLLPHDPHWEAEADAKASDTHPLAGFWKAEECKDDWGLAIGPMTETTYYVSFCGPGGCFEKGTYRPETKLYQDPAYRVIDSNAIEVEGHDGFTRYVRCPGRPTDAQQADEADERAPLTK